MVIYNKKKLLSKKSLKGSFMFRKIAVASLLLFTIASAKSEVVDSSQVETEKSTINNLSVDTVSAVKEISNSSAVDAERISKLEKKLAKILSKAGINIGGEFKSQMLYSKLKGKDLLLPDSSIHNSVSDQRKISESIEFTSVDFDITARPSAALSGRAIIRLHQDWRNFFSSLKNPISARWISMDGVVKNIFSYNIGDFHEKFSPLTMWSPDLEIKYEPEIFAAQRKIPMGEMFLENNNRFLQGVNLNFDAEIDPIFDEFHFNVMGARLRSAGVRPEIGGNSAVKDIEAWNFDHYVVGVNTDMTIIPDLNIGLTFMDIWDDKNSFMNSTGVGENMPDTAYLDVYRQRDIILAGRLGVGTAPFLAPKKMNFKLGAEFAISLDDSTWVDSISIIGSSQRKSDNISGIAVDAKLEGTFGLSAVAGKIGFNADFILNQYDYRNEMAQSPTLPGKSRIMNVENDYGDGTLYSSFDAMYRSAYKFTPSVNLSSAANGFFLAPVTKNAYTHSVLTKPEMDSLASGIDDAIFLVMPYGPATPNRTGLNGNIFAEFLNKAVLVSADGAYYKTVRDTLGGVNIGAKFLEIGGGASINLSKIGNWWKYPFVISGGYKKSTKENKSLIDTNTVDNISVDFVNVGLYWGFWKRASLLGGLQILNTATQDIDNLTKKSTKLHDIDFDQLHWAAGLEYKVSEGGTLTYSFGTTNLKRSINNGAVEEYMYMEHELYLTVNF